MQLTLDLTAVETEPQEPELTGYEPITCAETNVARQLVRDILKIIERGGVYYESYNDVFSRTIEVIEAAVLYEEDRYMELTSKMRPEAVKVCVDVMKPLMRMYSDFVVTDVLGLVYMEVASRWKCSGLGQYFTPADICEMMAMMQLGDNVMEQVNDARAEGRRISICDPAVGSGAMLLAAKKVILKQAGIKGLRQFTFHGQDVDMTCIRMCKIQLALTDYWYMGNRLICAAHDARSQNQ